MDRWCRRRHPALGLVVFPARAGMDRSTRARVRFRERVPRPRGDGPFSTSTSTSAALCSPPARGWTGWRRRRHRCRRVFPARAGMDRSAALGAIGAPSVPRPRGDGPKQLEGAQAMLQCSPPARGWTGEGFLDTASEVFPARAGMDRRWSSAAGARPCVPRPRGDGPEMEHRPSGSAISRCVPRPRGDGRRRLTDLVFPARAGMDRPRGGRSSSWRSVPRPRGDGPPYRTGRLDTSGVFPARAGMDQHRPRLGPRVPRPRGDGPLVHDVAPRRVACSPPARGWTANGGDPLSGDASGRVPRPRGDGPDEKRLTRGRVPRPRGDGPAAQASARACRACSPPARGWTAEQLGRRVFPARAGMDR